MGAVIATVTVVGYGLVTIGVPRDLEALSETDRDAVRHIDKALTVAVKAVGARWSSCPLRDLDKDPPGYIFRQVQAHPRDVMRTHRNALKMALAACLYLESQGYEVRESTPEGRMSEMIREHTKGVV